MRKESTPTNFARTRVRRLVHENIYEHPSIHQVNKKLPRLLENGERGNFSFERFASSFRDSIEKKSYEQSTVEETKVIEAGG